MALSKKINLGKSKSIIGISEWLKHAPYEMPINGYDTQFLPLCNHVLSIIERHSEYFKEVGMTLEERRQLAITLVAYFEDYINDIGIWKAFIETNKSLYGYALPFYDLSEYDEEYINAVDLAYLIYHAVSKAEEDNCYPPEGTAFGLGKMIFEYLEPKIDEINPTSFYDKYLVVKANDNFFDLKYKLIWFVQQSYLMSIDTKFVIQAQLAELEKAIKERPAMATYIGQIAYQMQDDTIYTHQSAYSALCATEWFAKIAKTDNDTKESIINLKKRHQGACLYDKDYDKDFYLYINMETKREYLVYKKSINHANSRVKSEDRLIFDCSLIFWDKMWWQTGTATAVQNAEYKKPQVRAYKVPWTYSDEIQKMQQEQVQEMYDIHIEVFGSPLYIAKDREDLIDKALQTTKVNNQKRAEVSQSDADFEAFAKAQKQSLSKAFDKNEKGIAFFYVKGIGQIFVRGIGDLVEAMESKNLSEEDQKDLFWRLASDLNPNMAAYLIANYPTHNIKFSGKKMLGKDVALLPFYWRFYSPEEFGIQVPSLEMR